MRSYILVCTECKNKIGCSAEELETRAVFCETCDGRLLVRCVWREHIPGDDLYSDPMGEPYKGLTNFIQTPMSDPVKPKSAEHLIRERENKFKIRTDK